MLQDSQQNFGKCLFPKWNYHSIRQIVTNDHTAQTHKRTNTHTHTTEYYLHSLKFYLHFGE